MDPSRRIHGRHPALPHGGAAADGDGVDPGDAQRWLARARALAETHGLPAPVLVLRGAHATLAQPCPPDLRDLAADLLDRATGEADDDGPIVARPDLGLRAWLAAADVAELPAFFDDDHLTVGFGAAAVRIPRADARAAPSVAGIGRIPIAVVTGTNGKTTTATLLGAIAAAAGYVPGVATSTGVRIGAALVEAGDWSGPGAARLVGDDPRVGLAVLETARGGLLRRGLLVSHVDVAVLTNVSADHLGEWGIETLAELAEVKRVVAEAVRTGGAVVTRADDPVLDAAVRAWLPSRPDLRWVRFDRSYPLPLPIPDIPLTLGGAAGYNVDNAIAAAAAARALGIPDDAIARGLRAVRPDPHDNPGRTNLWHLGGAQILVDYAHNPDGLRRLRELCDGLAPRRRWMVLGQAGDRPDALVRELAAEAAAIGCAGYVLKPLPGYARGREPQEVVEVLYRGLIAAGVDPARIDRVPTELAAVEWIAQRVEPGDLALLLVHEDLDAAVAALRARGASP